VRFSGIFILVLQSIFVLVLVFWIDGFGDTLLKMLKNLVLVFHVYYYNTYT